MAAHIVLPWIHRVFANFKTWALGVYHGLRRAHLQAYLIDDTLVQVGYNDPACAIRIWSLGENNGGGAVWGSFDCDNLTDPSTAGSTCSATGTFVFENCSK
jgi:hypothetical protein